MAENEKWHWQEPGTAWKGIGVYHVTLTIPSREPLFGTLVIPENDPSKARIDRTALGNAVVDELYVMCRHYPAIRILQFCLMPDHLHAVIHVTRVMDTSIRSVIRGYWQGVKKLGRAYTLSVSHELNSEKANEGVTTKEGGKDKEITNEGGYPHNSGKSTYRNFFERRNNVSTILEDMIDKKAERLELSANYFTSMLLWIS